MLFNDCWFWSSMGIFSMHLKIFLQQSENGHSDCPLLGGRMFYLEATPPVLGPSCCPLHGAGSSGNTQILLPPLTCRCPGAGTEKAVSSCRSHRGAVGWERPLWAALHLGRAEGEGSSQGSSPSPGAASLSCHVAHHLPAPVGTTESPQAFSERENATCFAF